MVQCAKGLAQNPRDSNAVSMWRGANHQVIFRLHPARHLDYNFFARLTFSDQISSFPNPDCLIFVNFATSAFKDRGPIHKKI